MQRRPVHVGLRRHHKTGMVFLVLGKRPDKTAEPISALELLPVVGSRAPRAMEKEHERAAASRLDPGPEEPIGHDLARRAAMSPFLVSRGQGRRNLLEALYGCAPRVRLGGVREKGGSVLRLRNSPRAKGQWEGEKDACEYGQGEAYRVVSRKRSSFSTALDEYLLQPGPPATFSRFLRINRYT
jgi:hypothetical protein